MKLDFDIVSQGGSLDFEIKNTKTINASGGIGEDVVREIIAEETANFQPKRDEALKTKSKEIVWAINELHEREDKQGLTEEQVKEVVRKTAVTQESDPTVPAWAKQPNKPTYTAEEVGALPKDTPLFSGSYNDLSNKPTIPSIEGLASEEYVDDKIAENKEVVLVDVAQMVMNQDNALFVDLSKRFLNGEIFIVGNVETINVSVSSVEVVGENEYKWTANNVTWHVDEQGEFTIYHYGIIGIENTNGVIYIGDGNIPFSEILYTHDVRDIPKYAQNLTDDEKSAWRKMMDAVGSTDTSKIVKEGLTNSDETFTDDEKQSARDLIGAVGVNNYAKPDGKTYGIVRAESWSPVTVDNNGTLIANIATDADIADRYRHRLLRCSDIDKAVKAGVTTNTEELTDDEKASARNWVGAVGFTDMPSTDGTKAGLYQIRGYGNGGLKVGADGKTEIQPPSEALIKQRCSDRPLTPKEIDYIIRYGLTGYKETWNGSLGQMVPSYENYTAFTDEEKGYACNLIGSVPKNFADTSKKVNFQRVFTNVYNTDGVYSNAELMVDFWNTATNNNIPVRNRTNGNIYLPNVPIEETESANKKYIANLPDYLTLTDEEKAEWCGMIGAFAKPTSEPTSMTSQAIVYSPILKTLTYTPMGSTSGGTSGSLVVYSDSTTDLSGMISNVGTIYVATPKGAKQTANKDYIDNLPNYLTLTDEQKSKWKAWLQAILA